MKNLVHTIVGILVAFGVLIALWYTNRDRFNINITSLATETGCIKAVNDSELRVIEEFEDKAVEAIAGKGFSSALPNPVDPTNWKPSLKSLTLLLDTDVVIDMALSRLRASIAEDQKADPTSLLNSQKASLSKMFDTARSWCATLPE